MEKQIQASIATTMPQEKWPTRTVNTGRSSGAVQTDHSGVLRAIATPGFSCRPRRQHARQAPPALPLGICPPEFVRRLGSALGL